MSVLNSDILTRAWLSGSNMYQQRIPNPTIASYAEQVQEIFAPYNGDLFNEFSGLLNGIIGTYVESKRFENPLRELKKPSTSFGHTERHVAVKYLQAHAGRFDDETLLKVERPEFVEWFYSVGEPRRYEFSWSRQELAQAFAADGYGYDDLLSATITQMLSSADYDEMSIMLQMFAEGDERMGGLYRANLSAAPTDKATAQELLQKARAFAGKMKFPTMNYNHIPIPVHENSDTLIFWATPDVLSVIDVYALADLFNIDKAEVKYRIIEVPEFPIPNVYAALTSEDFIYYRDFMTGMEPPFYNPGNRTMKYYYWANALIGVNPAANCILFTTDAETTIPTVTVEVTGMQFNLDAGQAAEVPIGGTFQLNLELQGSVDGDDSGLIAVEPEAGLYEVSAMREDEAIALNSRTYVDAYGKLHVQKTGLQAGDAIHVKATSVYVNPSGQTQAFTAETDVVVTDPVANGAKNCKVATDPYITYTDTTEDVSASE